MGIKNSYYMFNPDRAEGITREKSRALSYKTSYAIWGAYGDSDDCDIIIKSSSISWTINLQPSGRKKIVLKPTKACPQKGSVIVLHNHEEQSIDAIGFIKSVDVVNDPDSPYCYVASINWVSTSPIDSPYSIDFETEDLVLLESAVTQGTMLKEYRDLLFGE